MFVKDTVLRAGQRIFNMWKIRRLHAPSFFYYPNWIGLFDDNWRIRYTARSNCWAIVYARFPASLVKCGKMSTETASKDDNFGIKEIQSRTFLGGGNCDVPMRFNIIGDTKNFRPEHFCFMSTRNFGEGEKEENSFDCYSIKGRNLCTKIWLSMQIHNWMHTPEVSICKTSDATSKKPILIARFTTLNGRKFIRF